MVKLYFIVILFLICNTTNWVQGDPTALEISDLQAINALYSIWDLTAGTICTANTGGNTYITCDSTATHVTGIRVVSTAVGVFPSIPNLVYLTSLDVQVPYMGDIMNQLALYQSLQWVLTFYPFQFNSSFGSNFPATLTKVTLACNSTFPEAVFNSNNLQILDINDYQGFGMPTLTKNSASITTLSFDQGNFNNFIDLTFFSRFPKMTSFSYALGQDAFTFDSFDQISTTLNQLSFYRTQLSTTVNAKFPTSLFRMTNLTYLSIVTSRFIAPSISYYDFSLTKVTYVSMPPEYINSIQSPGILFPSSYGSFKMLAINTASVLATPILSNVNFNQNFSNLALYGLRLTSLPANMLLTNQSTPSMGSVSLGTNSITGALPGYFCAVQMFDASNNLFNDVPTCVKCAPKYTSNWLLTNPQLTIPTPTAACSTLTLNYTRISTVATVNYQINIQGSDLGWNGYIVDSNTLAYISTIYFVIPNYMMAISFPPGSGKNAKVTLMLHPNETYPTYYTLNYDYAPPILYSIALQTTNSFVYIAGNNFADTFANVTIVGKDYSIYSLSISSIYVSYPADLPASIFQDPTIFRVTVNVNGQSGDRIYNSLLGPPTIYPEGLPYLFLAGGIGIINGIGLTDDYTLFSLTLGGHTCDVTASTKTSFRFNYPVLTTTETNQVQLVIGGLYTYNFTVFVLAGAPTIVTPTTHLTKLGGTYQITGTNFYSNSTVLSLSVAGFPCTVTSSSPTSISFTYPALTGKLGSAKLNLVIADIYNITVGVTIDGPQPALNQPLPQLSVNGGSATLTGTNLDYDPDVFTLTIDGQTCNVTSSTSTSITFTYPPITNPGQYTLLLDTSGVYQTTQFITINGPIPSFNHPLPLIPKYSSVVTINGLNFGYSDLSIFNLTIDGQQCNITWTNDNSMTFTYPDLVDIGYNNIHLNTAGIYSLDDTIYVVGPEPIIDQQVDTLSISGGSYQLTGSNLTSDSSVFSLTIDGKTSQITSSTDSTLNFTYPSFDSEGPKLLILKSYQGYYTSYKYIGVRKPTPVCQPVTHGSCTGDGGTLKCDDGWSGNDCSGQLTSSTPDIGGGTPDSSSGSTITLPDGSTIQLDTLTSITEIREYNGITGGLVKSFSMTDGWEPNKISNSEFEYYKNITSNDLDTLVTINVKVYSDKEIISFANQNITMNPSTIKYRLSLTPYSFNTLYNRLMIVMSSTITGYESDSCTTITNGDESTSQSSEYIKLQLNDLFLYARFIKLGLVDDRVSTISNTILPSSETQTSNQLNTQIGINVPYFHSSVSLDPDFSVLLDTSGTSNNQDSPNSVCSSDIQSKKKLSSTQLAGIIIGVVVFGIAAILITIYFVRRHLQDKNFRLSFNSKLAKINRD